MVRIILFSGAALLLIAAQFPPDPRPASRPATASKKPGEFQPGVTIDWKDKTVRVAARIVLREGPLEFFACRPGKEHESILLLEATATHIYMAMGLVGLTPGKPPSWDEDAKRAIAASGDLVDVTIEWEAGGKPKRAQAFEWLLDAEYGRTPIPRPLVFTGSIRMKDGVLASDHSGSAIALVDFGDSLLSLSRNHDDRNADLWVLANTPAIPEVDTPVKLVLRAAAAAKHEMKLDFRGDVYVDGRYATVADAADLLDLARRIDKDYVQTIAVADALRADVERVRAAFRRAGLDETAVRFDRQKAPTTSPASQPASQPSLAPSAGR